ncbi:hypothetical protein IF1G_11320 [Cordyceps javanica]|uniref:Uncharacterized protein n=1 Tax=Cordyceps javanica TaxID=43265 RepID=A0A545UKM0_9HYPO|nr:hypothetical protein IF1G_11320 [Cordyceps javanica]
MVSQNARCRRSSDDTVYFNSPSRYICIYVCSARYTHYQRQLFHGQRRDLQVRNFVARIYPACPSTVSSKAFARSVNKARLYDWDSKITRVHAQCRPRPHYSPEETIARGQALNGCIYQGEVDAVLKLLEPHPHFTFAMMDVGYSFFFSDESVLTDVETKVGLLASLVVQPTPVEAASHVKGLGRLGLDPGIIQEIRAVSEEVAAFILAIVTPRGNSKSRICESTMEVASSASRAGRAQEGSSRPGRASRWRSTQGKGPSTRGGGQLACGHSDRLALLSNWTRHTPRCSSAATTSAGGQRGTSSRGWCRGKSGSTFAQSISTMVTRLPRPPPSSNGSAPGTFQANPKQPSAYAKRWWTFDLSQLRQVHAHWRNRARSARRADAWWRSSRIWPRQRRINTTMLSGINTIACNANSKFRTLLFMIVLLFQNCGLALLSPLKQIFEARSSKSPGPCYTVEASSLDTASSCGPRAVCSNCSSNTNDSIPSRALWSRSSFTSNGRPPRVKVHARADYIVEKGRTHEVLRLGARGPPGSARLHAGVEAVRGCQGIGDEAGPVKLAAADHDVLGLDRVGQQQQGLGEWLDKDLAEWCLELDHLLRQPSVELSRHADLAQHVGGVAHEALGCLRVMGDAWQWVREQSSVYGVKHGQ